MERDSGINGTKAHQTNENETSEEYEERVEN